MKSPSPATVPDELELLPADAESEFNLAEYLGMVRRHWKLVAAAMRRANRKDLALLKMLLERPA